MRLSFCYYPKFSDLQLNIIEELSYHTTKLYNIVNYDLIQNGYVNYYETEKRYKGNYHNKFLHSHTYQQCLKLLEENWKSYFGAIKDYNKDSKKYKGKPNTPKYKNCDNRKNEVIFTNLAIRVKGSLMLLSLSKEMQEKFKVKSLNFVISDRLQKLVDFSKIQQIKIRYDNALKGWDLILIYLKEEKVDNTRTNVMAVDIGLNNIGACTNLENSKILLINGKTLKSKNRYINNEISKLESIEMKRTGNKHYKNTKRIINLKRYRKNYIKNYLHKASKMIIEYAKENNCSKVIVGNLKDIKQGMKYNKSFKEIPIQMLVDQIEYKGKLEAIEIIKISESYTSGVSALDNEEINKSSYKKSRRITRGLFRSNSGILINADINGSLNILRKYLKQENNDSSPKLIKEVMDKGCTSILVKLMIA